MKLKPINTPVFTVMCSTCPFRPGSKYANLQDGLAESALNQGSRTCHSTGTNAIGGRTGKPDRLCRGARDLQLRFFRAIGFIEAETDEAWKSKCKELGLLD